MNRVALYFIVCLSCCYFSCSKDQDEESPTISVEYPLNNVSIFGQDTIRVKAAASDNEQLTSVRVSLKNANGSQVGSSIVKSPGANSYTLDELFFLNDVHLPSGSYYFDFMATDGENETHKFVDVVLTEVTKKTLGLFVVSNNGTSSDIHILDSTLTTSFYRAESGDFLNIGVNSFDQQLVYAAKNTGMLTAVDLNSGTASWSKPIVSDHTSLFVNNSDVFLGRINGTLTGFDHYGGEFLTGSSIPGYYAESANVIGDYYFSEQQALSSSNVQLALFWTASGMLAQQVSVNEDILGIYGLSQNEVILITNSASNTGNVIFYYLSTGLTSSPFSVSLGQIDAVTEISTGIYLVAEAGNLTLLNVNSFTSLPYLTGVPAKELVYDQIRNELFVVHNNQITVYDYSTKLSKGTYTHPSLIDDIALWYNK